MTYGDAEAQCKSDGSFLAIPRSEAENDFIASLIPKEHIWIGINDIEQEGSFVAVDGREISWTNWLTGQPDGGVDQNAVAIDSLSDGRWRDLGVQYVGVKNVGFVCSIYIEGTLY